MKFFDKTAYVGQLLNMTMPKNESWASPITLKRGLRKHKKQKLPDTYGKYHIAKAVEGLDKDLTKKVSRRAGFHYPITYTPVSRGGTASPFGHEFAAPSPYGTVAGHEIGHLTDEWNRPFNERRAIRESKHPALKINERLKSERNATQAVFDRLPASVKRSHGAELAHAFDTYRAGVRREALDRSVHWKRTYGARAATVWSNVHEGLPYSDELPKVKKIKEDAWFTRKYYKQLQVHEGATNALLSTAHKLKDMGSPDSKKVFKTVAKNKRVMALLEKGLDREKKQSALQHQKDFDMEVNKVRRLRQKNFKTMVENLATLPEKQQKIVRREVRDYVRRTRRTFGNDIARSVIKDIRTVQKAVKAIK